MSDKKVAPPQFTDLQNQFADLYYKFFPDAKHITLTDVDFLRTINKEALEEKSVLKKYYLQDSRSVVGNFLLFWAKDRRGYTTDIDKAHEFTLAEALSERDTDVPWSIEEMRSIARLRVDHQNLAYTYKEQRQRLVKMIANGELK